METQHHHEHASAHEHGKEKFGLPASIIIGAVLISASIFYNTKLILESGGGKTALAPAAAQGQVQAQVQDPTPAPVAPQGPVTIAERSDAAVLGKASAPVTFVEFTDFQCPFCQRFFNEAYGQIKSKYVDTGKVKIIFRHYPLSFHVNAEIAGVAAECANRQGKFVQYHDILFKKGQADGTGLDVASLKQYASDAGLNTSKFNTCLDNKETLAIVQKDQADGNAAGVSGTPTMFVNGNKIVGAQPFSSFEQAIEQELKK